MNIFSAVFNHILYGIGILSVAFFCAVNLNIGHMSVASIAL